jgi:DnaK suppressor protein
MSIIWVEEPKDQKMDAQQIKDTRERLASEYHNLIKAMNRKRTAVEEITVENTEDEGDLGRISHDRDVLYNLHEGGFVRLQFIQKAIKALDRGQYGECLRCGEAINKKRLEAVPWATMCIHCQEDSDAEDTSARMVVTGQEAEETEV